MCARRVTGCTAPNLLMMHPSSSPPAVLCCAVLCCAQVVEDALCLVFLQHQFTDLLAKEGADKMVDVVKKTWRKMGPKGQAAALTLDLPSDQANVVKRALGA